MIKSLQDTSPKETPKSIANKFQSYRKVYYNNNYRNLSLNNKKAAITHDLPPFNGFSEGSSDHKHHEESTEKVGKNIGKAVEKALPIVEGIARVARDLGDL
nr:unnamed protein product [Callosobruchus analis]